jgi:arylsulfatase B
MFGKWHLGLASTMFHPLNHGFTHFYGHYNGAIDYFSRERFGELDWHRNFDSVHEEGYSTDLIGKAAAKFIDAQDGKSPFYMVVAFNAPHSPIQAKRSDLDEYGFEPAGERAPNTDRNIAKREQAPDYGESGKGNTVRQTFSAMVASLDQNIGHILGAVERKGMGQNTLVILHSDNGADPRHGGSNQPLRGNKFTAWEGGVRVVAMIRWPARFEGGRSYESVAGYVDVLPTLLAAAGGGGGGGGGGREGGEAPENIDGINLLPFLEGSQAPPERSLLLGGDAVVSDRWKLKSGEIFDLKDDPLETQSVKNPPAEILAELRARLADFPVMTGPQTATRLPPPQSWPPPEWKLPQEKMDNSSDNSN